MEDWEISYGNWKDPIKEPPKELDCRIKLTDGSELNVWAQADGDWWSDMFQIFIAPDKVVGYKYNKS